ncbi:Myb-like DNA-binding domain-containing protein [Giardia muris]|uniref:Myb-like DNA-binding domain-containing protein n=1 Tax=Giardia muris TaxID=5742 RepID=A0A4Z1SXV8_GIAMU|nr:Myb-like DNA-binding domain-containing protein [Giardia muris]|eukprot:TNJ30544.1 Myb-like DNA-binding domain-containing protein [Giardia muris]
MASTRMTPRKWTEPELMRLYTAIQLEHCRSEDGKIQWAEVAKFVRTRNRVQCYQRYNQIDALKVCGSGFWQVRRRPWSVGEVDALLKLHEKLGNAWAQYRDCIPGRTPTEIKSKYRNLVKQGHVQSETKMGSKEKGKNCITSGDVSINATMGQKSPRTKEIIQMIMGKLQKRTISDIPDEHLDPLDVINEPLNQTQVQVGRQMSTHTGPLSPGSPGPSNYSTSHMAGSFNEPKTLTTSILTKTGSLIGKVVSKLSTSFSRLTQSIGNIMKTDRLNKPTKDSLGLTDFNEYHELELLPLPLEECTEYYQQDDWFNGIFQ